MADRRVIEAAFPVKGANIGSAHEKKVRHGHISTLHSWPTRLPLAACRAALIATLLPSYHSVSNTIHQRTIVTAQCA